MDIKEIVKNKKELIDLKKAEVKHVKGGLSGLFNVKSTANKSEVNKADSDTISKTIIGNTYMWLDSHGDVHAKGVFTKSVKERGTNIFHLHDHEFKIVAKVGQPTKVYEDVISWKSLGVNKDGETQALFMDSNIKKSYNEIVFDGYKDGSINQHSVGMQYVKIDLAVNDEDYEEEYKVWKENIDSIGNKDKAEEAGYFWFVREAKLIEISAVLAGSNELTPTIEDKQEPLNDTLEEKKAADSTFDISNAISNLKIKI